MHLLERHQQAAIVVYLIVISVAYKRFGFEGFKMNALMLSIFLILIIFYKFGASLMGMGFMAKLARDSNSTANSAAFAFFMWIFFLIASGFILFGKGFIK